MKYEAVKRTVLKQHSISIACEYAGDFCFVRKAKWRNLYNLAIAAKPFSLTQKIMTTHLY